ncbi:hypothetical protein RSOLAG1IB_12525 [Rhizoctonia solani AG-1 IB]|uniref:Uncharacterized protein n=1 Tax=Thanatephorus cucumeris (strain AG1-IB / isolate 7/3/14) TaxID=1108050 RepID=A0A0B7FZD1_THACB|nr:hypothetical protein RSOLAG1IB_12525 [Rhizoctonia solani AG-1 IB]
MLKDAFQSIKTSNIQHPTSNIPQFFSCFHVSSITYVQTLMSAVTQPRLSKARCGGVGVQCNGYVKLPCFVSFGLR